MLQVSLGLHDYTMIETIMFPAGGGVTHFALGMCYECYRDYMEVTMGALEGGSDPPAYTRSIKGASPKKPPRHPALPSGKIPSFPLALF